MLISLSPHRFSYPFSGVLRISNPTSSRSGIGLNFLACLAVLLVSFCHGKTSAQLPTSRLDTFWPVGGSVGTDFDFVIDGGEFTDEAFTLLTSSPEITWVVNTGEPRFGRTERTEKSGHFHLTIPEKHPEGIVEIRFQGRYGISNTRRFWVSRLPTVTALSPRHSFETALEVGLNQVVQGRLTNEQIDHYRVAFTKDQHIRFAVRALQLDSAASITVVVRDADGKELLRSRSSKSEDTAVDWIVPADGAYTVQIHDLLFRGGNDYYYQLEIAETVPHTPNDAHQNHAGHVGPQKSPARPLQDASPIPTDSPVRLAFPADARFEIPTSGIPIRCDLTLKGGQKVVVDLDTEEESPATDLQLVIERLIAEEGKPLRAEKIAEQDDNVHLNGSFLEQRDSNPNLLFTPPVDGDYRFTIRDLQTVSLRESVEPKSFRISIIPANPEFAVFAILPHASFNPAQSLHHGCLLRRGQTLAIEVGAKTTGGFFEDLKGEMTLVDGLVKVPYDIPWVWPIEVAAEGLPESVTVQSAILDRNHRRGLVVLTANESAPAWSGEIRLKATVKTDQGSVEKEVQWLEMRRPDPQGKGRVPVTKVDSCPLAISDLEMAPLQIEIGTSETRVFQGKRGTPLKIPIKLTRSETTKGKVTIRPIGLPADTSAGEIALEGDNLQGELQINLGANAVLGPFRFLVNAEVETPWPRNPESLQRERVYLQELETQVTTTEEANKGMLEQAIQQTKDRIKQLEESTKPQNTRAFILSNSVEVIVDAQ